MFRNHHILAPGCIRKEVEQVTAGSELLKGIKSSYFDYSEELGDPGYLFNVSRGLRSDFDILLLCDGSCPEINVPEKYSQSVNINKIEHIYSLLTENSVLDKYRQEGAFFVVPGWLDNWKKLMELRGYYEDNPGKLFSESYSYVLILDTGIHGDFSQKAEDFSRKTGIPYKILYVGMDHFRMAFEHLVLKWSLKSTNSKLKLCNKKTATYAMSLDFIKSLADMTDEPAIIGSVCNIFSTLFAPGSIIYYSVKKGKMQFEYCKPTNTEEKYISTLRNSYLDHFVFENEDGFVMKIKSGGSLLGIIEIRDIAFPEHLEEYLSIAYDIAKAAGLTVSNVRRYHELFTSKEELEKLAELLRHTNSILRHDIANDLQVILIALDMLEEKNNKSYISMIRNAAKKSALLINNVRELDSFSSGEDVLEFFNVRQVLDTVTGKHDVEFYVEGDAIVLGDNALLSVFDNIVSNAVLHGNASRIYINIDTLNEKCRISIADNGRGIPKDVKPRIFEKGFKHGTTGHTGLGLFIAKKTIERYKGCISVEDNYPCGTKFIVELDSAIMNNVH
ncbi:MAG: ATP-binding protein [Methanolobus sp.]